MQRQKRTMATLRGEAYKIAKERLSGHLPNSIALTSMTQKILRTIPTELWMKTDATAEEVEAA
jgi:hypothetical protein